MKRKDLKNDYVKNRMEKKGYWRARYSAPCGPRGKNRTTATPACLYLSRTMAVGQSDSRLSLKLTKKKLQFTFVQTLHLYQHVLPTTLTLCIRCQCSVGAIWIYCVGATQKQSYCRVNT